MQFIDVNELVPITTRWWDAADDPTEPTAIDITVREPDGTVTAYTKADMTGSAGTDGSSVLDTWVLPLTATAEGVWRVLAVGTTTDGPVTQPEFMFLVSARESFAPGVFEQWCTWADVLAICPQRTELASLDPGVADRLIDWASWILYSLDGSRFPGIGETCRDLCRGCLTCRRDICCCSPRHAIDLGTRWPVWAAWDISIDGEMLDPGAYEIRDRRYLVRTDGETWPRELSGCWALGRRPPVGLRDACARFVAEMAKSCLGLKCELPQRVTSLTREGVSYVVLDSQKFLDEGRTGYYPVDLALIAAQKGRRRGPGGFSPYSPAVTTSRPRS